MPTAPAVQLAQLAGQFIGPRQPHPADMLAAIGGVRFVQPKGSKSYTTVPADVERVNASLARDPNNYVGAGGGGPGAIKGRYARFGNFLGKGQPVEMPRMSMNRGEATIGDGRHRFAYLRDAGVSTMPVVVPTEYADEFTAKFGAKG